MSGLMMRGGVGERERERERKGEKGESEREERQGHLSKMNTQANSIR